MASLLARMQGFEPLGGLGFFCKSGYCFFLVFQTMVGWGGCSYIFFCKKFENKNFLRSLNNLICANVFVLF